jgi:hypothetical protein
MRHLSDGLLQLLAGMAVSLSLTCAGPSHAQPPKPSINPPKAKFKNLPSLRSSTQPTQEPSKATRPIPSEAVSAALPLEAEPPSTERTGESKERPQTKSRPKLLSISPPPVKIPTAGKQPEPLSLPSAPNLKTVKPSLAEEESPWASANAESIYRPLAAVVTESEASRGATSFVSAKEQSATVLPHASPLPDPIPGAFLQSSPVEEHQERSWLTNGSGEDLWFRVAPSELLWQPFLANAREPRMFAKAARIDGENVFDAAVGGQFGLVRISSDQRPQVGLQLDLFAVVLSRFTDGDDLQALDYRFGVPLTYSNGCWSFKFVYEHTASEIQYFGFLPPADFRTEEIAFGISRRWGEVLRTYGQVAFTFAGTPAQTDDPLRLNFGVEWADLLCTTASGAPFGAVDLELRGDQGSKPNVTAQLGWVWRGALAGRGPRLCFEYRNGRSPFGQFFDRKENSYGVAALFDW